LNNGDPIVAAVGAVAVQFADQMAISVASVTESRVAPASMVTDAPAAFWYV